MTDEVKIFDLYSNVSHNYVVHRPNYPASIFEFLSSFTATHHLALDVATGNGQAASKLADIFQHIKATDASDKQLLEAAKKPNVEYLCLPAELTKEQCEQNGFHPNSFDIITCATAIHWLDANKFFDMAKLLLKPSGIMAIFAYEPFRIFDNPELNGILESYFESMKSLTTQYQFVSTTDGFREVGYKQIYFPFDHVGASWELDAKQFSVELSWTLNDVRGYMQTWSSTSLAIDKWGYNPSDMAVEKLKAAWGPDAERKVIFPMFYRIGRKV